MQTVCDFSLPFPLSMDVPFSASQVNFFPNSPLGIFDKQISLFMRMPALSLPPLCVHAYMHVRLHTHTHGQRYLQLLSTD